MLKGLVYKDRWGRYIAICPICGFEKILHPSLGVTIKIGCAKNAYILHNPKEHMLGTDLFLAEQDEKIYPDGRNFPLVWATPLDIIALRKSNEGRETDSKVFA